MYGIQVMVKGKWKDVENLGWVKRGQPYRLKTGPQQWSEPKLAHSRPVCTPHPLNPHVQVWSLDGLCETIRK